MCFEAVVLYDTFGRAAWPWRAPGPEELAAWKNWAKTFRESGGAIDTFAGDYDVMGVSSAM